MIDESRKCRECLYFMVTSGGVGKCMRHAPRVIGLDGDRPLTFFPCVIASNPACGDANLPAMPGSGREER